MNELRVEHETTLYEKMTEAGQKEDSELGNDTMVASEADVDSAHRTKQKKRKSASLMSNK
jgi:hypothetical protein